MPMRPIPGVRWFASTKVHPTQLIGEVREPIPAAPGQPERYDCEYKRNGTANLFVFLDAHKPWRHVKVTDHRGPRATSPSACAISRYPLSGRGSDPRGDGQPFNSHGGGLVQQRFPAPEAHRVLQRLEFHYTPKHASWLNMVEIEIGVLRGHCLDRRIGEREFLVSEIDTWQRQRESCARIKWKFTTQKAQLRWHCLSDTAKES